MLRGSAGLGPMSRAGPSPCRRRVRPGCAAAARPTARPCGFGATRAASDVAIATARLSRSRTRAGCPIAVGRLFFLCVGRKIIYTWQEFLLGRME